MLNIAGKYYRPNVAAVIFNNNCQVLLGRRSSSKKNEIWQFPQGGVEKDETLEQALYREIKEETNLDTSQLQMIDSINKWIYYKLPKFYKKHNNGNFDGQKQRWFLLKLIDDNPNFFSPTKEFSDFKWVSYYYPLHCVIDFKRDTYSKVLSTFNFAVQQNISASK